MQIKVYQVVNTGMINNTFNANLSDSELTTLANTVLDVFDCDCGDSLLGQIEVLISDILQNRK